MKLHKTIPVKFQDKEYEIRVYHDESKINIVVFNGTHPLNGIRHQIIVPGKYNVLDFLEKEPVQELIEISKSDITEKRWERMLA